MADIFAVLSWDESTVYEISGEQKINRASVTQKYEGVLSGESQAEYTMYYRSEASSSFVGIESFKGELNGKKGILLLEHRGTFENGVVHSSFSIIDALEGLVGVKGSGSFTAGSHGNATYALTLQ